MTSQLAWGTALIVLSIAIQAVLMAVAVRTIRRRAAWLGRPPYLPKLAGAFCGVSLWLLMGLGASIWIWAVFLHWTGALADLELSLYFSLVSFTTLGFGDILLDKPYRLLSGMMAADGLILFGLTTAFLIEFIRSLHVAQAEAADGD
ncbi:MAG: two pore domain potassium channel family protein [Rhodospirillaceae bacterium]|nr:two pore domain potassium channel family protein [Rhodospirillaceae bacterium]MYB12059.1 two pore domain potassium channel family protein [Rhodospirillaceae bacterium]MYI50927.1 two pore domain potassium channel family protein [Rhodospirillaceae bacterium]